jgi:hypothetical protein
VQVIVQMVRIYQSGFPYFRGIGSTRRVTLPRLR